MKGLFRIRIFVSGNVQGVFFRVAAKEKAETLGVVGYVKNLSNGRVEILGEASREKLLELARWAGIGPRSAAVARCEKFWEAATGEFSKFEIT